MKVEIKGLDKVTANLQKMIDKTPEVIEEWLEGHGNNALARVKLRTPVDTGDLRRNWEKQPLERAGDTYSIEVTNNVEYARHVEFPHRTRNGRSVVPGVFMAKTTKEITEAEMEADKSKLAKRIGGK